MLDSWFWQYFIRVIVATGAMIALMYGAFYWLKARQPVEASGQPDASVKPPAWLAALQRRFGLKPSQSNTQGTIRFFQPAPTPVSAASPDAAGSVPASVTDSPVQFYGPMVLNAGQQVGVVAVGDQHWVVASGPNGITLLAEATTKPAKTPHKTSTHPKQSPKTGKRARA